uniref:MAP7 domain-containing protein n=1 Tax=Strigamia maritima TaxID=126957 RepID=T1IUB4_STRMM
MADSHQTQPELRDKPDGGGMFSQVDREERIRILRERQTEERQKKLDELKLAALHAQKVREQQEDDRRRKIDELRMRDHERRSQVEERKQIIWLAEKERKEAILRKNLERETRLEAKRNAQRSSIGFAFGSSTPRIFDVDSGYFGSRRAASQTNMSTSMINGGSRHSAEREIEKKKAISAYSLDNKSENQLLTRAPEPFSQWSSAVISPSFSEDSLDNLPVNSRTGAPTECDLEEAQNEFCPPPLPAFPTNRFTVNLVGSGVFVGEDLMTRSCTSIGVPLGRGRRKTDLHPTILPVQDSPRNQSPGRAYSMTRLDQLATPRRHVNLQALHESSEQRGNRVVTTTNSLGIKTKSMTHLAQSTSPCRRRLQSANKRFQQTRPASKSLSHLAGDAADASSLQNNKLAKSLWQLPPTAPPRATRASQLRANAMLLMVNRQGMSKSMMHLVKKKSSDEYSDRSSVATRTTPSSPSRPNSSLSQQSISSHASQNSVTMRARTPARRSNRPLSIAGTTPDSTESVEERQGRMTPIAKTPRAKSVGAERLVGDVSLSVAKASPPPPSARKPPTAARVEAANKKSVNSPREKPKVAPKPAKLLVKASPKQSPTVEQAPPIPAVSPDAPKDIPSETKTEIKKPKVVEAETAKTANVENIPAREETTPPPPPPVAETAAAKPRLTTEGEAKAALAERRRQAREQAEREAELERQRQEQLLREEEERIRQEEEERQRWEIEQDELRIIEAERLQKAIEEQSLREEEEKKKRDEEAKLKIERQEQERKAREEQEKIRKETEEQLRKEEEERAERRKRVEAIMSRTRGKGCGNSGNTPVTTPTKPNEELPGSEQSPMQTSLIVESKPNKIDDLMSTSMPSVVNCDLSHEWKHNGDLNSRANGVSTNPFAPEMDQVEAVVEPADDFASRDIINQKPQLTNADFEQLIDLSVCPPTNTFSKNEDFINNADSLNSNVPSNGTSAPFIAFEDNFAKKQETNVTG